MCINQGDLEEKQNQIQLMGKIYSRAKAVYVWLGPANGATELGMKAMAVLAQQRIPKHILEEGGRDDSQTKLPLPDSVNMSELESFLSCKWFTRLWTVQEIARGHQEFFVCGKEHIEWQTFYDGVQWLYLMWHKPHKELWIAVRSAFTMSLLKKQYRRTVIKKGYGLDYLLYLTIHYETTNPWDRIYGLLGMVSEYTAAMRKAPAIIPNYSTPLADVYREATWHALRYPGPAYLNSEEGDGLVTMVMGHYVAPVPEDEIDEWPSWVPRYHETRTYIHNLPPAPAGGGASSDCHPVYKLDPANAKILIIHGVLVRTIRAIHVGTMAEFLVQLWDTQREWDSRHFVSLQKSLNVVLDSDVTPSDLARYLLDCQPTAQKGCTELRKMIDHFDGENGHLESARNMINDVKNSAYKLIELDNGDFA